jgi:hypothetical protein
MKLDRTYQRELLEMLAQSYPSAHDVGEVLDGADADGHARYAANMIYLEEHGLVQSGLVETAVGHILHTLPRITARGMDFLADDGGLSAILGMVTVKLHEDTLKDLIGQKIAESNLPAPEKSRLLDQIKALPAEAIKHLPTPARARPNQRRYLPELARALETQNPAKSLI